MADEVERITRILLLLLLELLFNFYYSSQAQTNIRQQQVLCRLFCCCCLLFNCLLEITQNPLVAVEAMLVISCWLNSLNALCCQLKEALLDEVVHFLK